MKISLFVGVWKVGFFLFFGFFRIVKLELGKGFFEFDSGLFGFGDLVNRRVYIFLFWIMILILGIWFKGRRFYCL